MPDLPFKSWPEGNAGIARDPRSIRRMYERGFAGCETRPKQIAAANELFDEEIRGGGGWPIGEDAARLFWVEDYGKGKLCLNFLDVQRLYPDAFPVPAQARGDCVSHSQKNSDLITVAVEVNRGKPDEVSGLVEGAPEISIEGQRQGCFSTEWSYWHRGYNSDGWSCYSSARVSTKHGCMVRKKHSDELDLTVYSGELAGRYGRRPPPEEFEKIGRQHLIRTATRISGWEQVRDFVAAGFGCGSCGSEGFASNRNEDGVSRRRGNWSHAMAVCGVDDRQDTVKKYGEPIILIQNSWGSWNTGPRRVMGTNIDIPHGSFWSRWSDVRSRTYYAMSSAMGWEPKELYQIKTRW